MKLPILSTGVLRQSLMPLVKANRIQNAIIASARGAIGIPGGQSLGYTCDSETNTCNCKGIIDCDDMRDSGECEGVVICSPESCTCDWHKSKGFSKSPAFNTNFPQMVFRGLKG